MRRLAAGVLCFLAMSAPAQAGVNADEVLRDVAERVSHGKLDDSRTAEELDRLIERRRIYVTCANASLLAQRELARHGIESRLVATVTRRRFNELDNSHVMLEVRRRGQWVVYDLDHNRQPVDAEGHGITVRQLVRDPHREFRILSRDKRYDLRRVKPKRYTRELFDDLDSWYDRILGTPAVFDGRHYLFTDRSERRRVERWSAGSYRWTRSVRDLYRR